MSSKTKKINDLLDEQQAILNSIKAEALEFDTDKLAKQNEQLTLELDEANRTANKLAQENTALKKELDNTKTTLFTKLAQEKLSVFERRQKELDLTYYREGITLSSKLDEYARNCITSLDSTIRTIEGYGSSEFTQILQKLEALKAEATEKQKIINAYKTQELDNAKKTNFTIGEKLKAEPLTEYEKHTAQKQKSIESFIGLNIIGKAGILLFIVGIIMLGRFAYTHMSDALKGGLIYLLAIALICVGELFHKKENTVFSTTLISGGVATLYAACATSYFAFHIYGIKATFIICIAITAIAIALSNQIKSQIVCGFAGVGGYLPVVALYMVGFGKAAADITFIPVSCAYFCVLAVVIYIMTYNKKWHIAQFIGYGLHLISIGGIAKCAYSLRAMTGYGFAPALALIFAVASFIIYLLMPATKIIKSKPLSVWDCVLLVLNTISGAVSVSITVRNCMAGNAVVANRVTGFVFLAFTAIYAVLMAFSIREKRGISGVSSIITSISALVFSMFVVPLMFGIEYAAIGWAAEGVILAIISIEKRLNASEFAGFICMLLSVPVAIYTLSDKFSVLSILTFSIVLSSFWIYSVRGIIETKSQSNHSFVYYLCEIAAAFASAGYIYYLYTCITKSPAINFYCDFTDFCVAVIACMLALIILRLGIFRNNASMLVSNIGGAMLIIAVMVLNVGYKYNDVTNIFYETISVKSVFISNLALLVIVNVATELLFARSVFDIINRLNASPWIFTISISISMLALITSALLVQLGVEFSSVIISAVYLAIACLLLFIGFRKNYTIVRSSGLVLVLCSFAKLCFVDTSHLDSGWKIASYFAFGALLIFISFFYQRFTKKIENE